MALGMIAGAAILAVFLLYVLFFSPKPDLVFSSPSDEDIRDMKRYLEDSGINVYVKGMDTRTLHETAHDLVNPTLHVVHTEDRPRALALIRDKGQGGKPPAVEPR